MTMDSLPLNVVTGAFSSGGRCLAGRLLAMGERAKTLST